MKYPTKDTSHGYILYTPYTKRRTEKLRNTLLMAIGLGTFAWYKLDFAQGVGIGLLATCVGRFLYAHANHKGGR